MGREEAREAICSQRRPRLAQAGPTCPHSVGGRRGQRGRGWGGGVRERPRGGGACSTPGSLGGASMGGQYHWSPIHDSDHLQSRELSDPRGSPKREREQSSCQTGSWPHLFSCQIKRNVFEVMVKHIPHKRCHFSPFLIAQFGGINYIHSVV